MKRCPECRRDYYDDTLLYCLDDGNALLEGPASMDEPKTAILPQPEVAATGFYGDEGQPLAQARMTDRTAILPAHAARRGRRFGKWLVAIPLLILVAGGALAIYKYAPFGGPKIDISLAEAKVTKLTTSGKATLATISPDGKYVVHTQEDGRQQSLYMRQVATQSNVQILPPAPMRFMWITFSPSGDHIYYSVSGPEYLKLALFKLPTLGGQPQKIKEDINSGQISFSPDGKRFVFTRNIDDSTYQMFIADADGANEEKVLETKTPNAIDGIAWSPDGERIAYEDFNASAGSRLFELRLSDRSSRQISDMVWCCGMGGLKWTNDGSSLMLWASNVLGLGQIWQLSYPSGEVKQLTNDPEGLTPALGLTADSGTLTVVRSIGTARIWVGPADKAEASQPITSSASKLDDFPSWFPDGRVLFLTNSLGKGTLWTVNADGSNLKQISTSAENADFPLISPDGSTIAFTNLRGYEAHVWLMKADGSEPRQITTGDGYIQHLPTSFSPDGKWLFYTKRGVDSSAWKVSADGTGDAVRITDKVASNVQVSPDGRLIAYRYKDDAKAPFRLAIAPIDGGEPIQTFAYCPTCTSIRWSPDGRSLVYTETSPNGVGNLMSQPISGGEPKKLTEFKSDLISSFAYSRDGKQIALSRGTSTSDVWLYTGLK